MSQHAVMVTRAGAPVELGERPIPTPQENQILVQVSIAGLNPHDQIVRQIAYFVGDNLPSPIGIDIVGTVIELGANVKTFSLGDQVFGQGDPSIPDQAGTQEFCVLDAAFAAKLPTSISHDEAATLPLNALTMFIALFDKSTLNIPSPLDPENKSFGYENMKIVIIGAGSNCGKIGVQLAKFAGVGTIIGVAGKRGEAGLKSLGVTHVIDRDLGKDEIERQVRDIVGDDLLHVCDTINSLDQSFGIRMLSNGKKGTFVPLRYRGTADQSSVGPKAAGYEIKRFVCRPSLFYDTASAFWRAIPQLIEQKVLKPTKFSVIEGFDVAKVNAVLDQYRLDQFPTKPHIHIPISSPEEKWADLKS